MGQLSVQILCPSFCIISFHLTTYNSSPFNYIPSNQPQSPNFTTLTSSIFNPSFHIIHHGRFRASDIGFVARWTSPFADHTSISDVKISPTLQSRPSSLTPRSRLANMPKIRPLAPMIRQPVPFNLVRASYGLPLNLAGL